MRNPVMIGERLYLRPLEKEDAVELARYTAEETETFFDMGRTPVSPLAWERWITKLYTHEPGSAIHFAVCRKEDDRLIGTVGISSIDWINRVAETEAWLGGAENRGKGYGPEAKHLLLEYCFERIHLHMVYSWVWEPNFRSAAAVRRQGYRDAGRVKTLGRKEGRFRDALMFDLFRDEWLAARDAWRARQEAKS
ncbi:MAG: GNAT family protein [Sphaerobacter sp.]|nr:GNAT family protein [Sphaerobacter sp.]